MAVDIYALCNVGHSHSLPCTGNRYKLLSRSWTDAGDMAMSPWTDTMK